MKVPSRTQTEQLLQAAARRNPGPWVEHSLYVARAAELIAAHHPEMEAEVAYILGCLHDIGRQEGVTQMRHIIDGYNFLQAQQYDDAARICLTHSFPAQKIGEAFGTWDCSPAEYAFVADYLQGITFTPYDRLLQLCDALALPTGFCALEKRFIHVVMRYGFNKFTLDKWRATYMIQADFEAVMGCSIYTLLPGVMENTFGTEFEVGENYFRIKEV
jgi:hypothetical protein